MTEKRNAKVDAAGRLFDLLEKAVKSFTQLCDTTTEYVDALHRQNHPFSHKSICEKKAPAKILPKKYPRR